MTHLLPLVVALLPFLGAVLVLLVGGRGDPHLHATDPAEVARAERVRFVALGTLGPAIAAIVWGTLGDATFEAPAIGSYRAVLQVDGVTAVLVPSFLAAAFLAFAAAPRRSLNRRDAAVALGTLGAGLLVTMAGDVILLGLGWLLGLLPLAVLAQPGVHGRRVVVGFAVGRVVLLFAGLALGVYAALQRGDASPLSIHAVATAFGALSMAMLVLVTLAALARLAVFPFHVWLIPFADAAPPLVFVVTFAANVGLVVVLRIALPLASALVEDTVPFVAIVGLIAALHAALRALGEARLRRLVALTIGSQLGIVLVGASALREQATAGAMMGSAAVALGATGLLLVVNAVESRVGAVTLDARRHVGVGGLAEAMPRASLAWFALAFAIVAIPGSLAFVAEDLVLHGLLAAHPVLSVVMLLVSVVNAVTLMRAGAQLFLGEPKRTYSVPDLLLRERFAIGFTIVFLLGAGLMPARLSEVASHASRALGAAPSEE